MIGRAGEAYVGYDGSTCTRWPSHPSRSIYIDVSGHGLANFRIGFRSGDTWDAYGCVRNALGKEHYQELNAATGSNTGLVAGIPGDARTWGLTVRARF